MQPMGMYLHLGGSLLTVSPILKNCRLPWDSRMSLMQLGEAHRLQTAGGWKSSGV